MKSPYFTLMLLCVCPAAVAQTENDSADIYFNHLNLNEVVVSTPVGQIKRKQSATPISVVTDKTLRQTASTNIVDAIARQPGMAQVSTGSGISKPIIRGLGYNRIVSIADGVRQEGQQWGDEHGLEIDGLGVSQIEILKGPASLMYGSDAMAGVVIFQPEAIEASGRVSGSLSSEYQTCSGLAAYSLHLGGNRQGIVWNGRYTERHAHAYRNKYDGYVPGTQFAERAASGMVGLNRAWGFSHLTLSYYHMTPSIAEGERDELTGLLESNGSSPRSYAKALPYQQIGHYKAVWDNSIALPGAVLKATLGYQQNRRQEFEEEETPVEAGLDFRLHTATYDVHYVHSGFDGWKLTIGAGGMWQSSANEGEEYLIPAYRLFDIGAYATLSRTLSHWTLSGGVRADSRHLHSLSLTDDGEERFSDFRRHFEALTGSVGAVCHVNRNVNLRANLARGFRAPNLSELGSNGIHEGTFRYEQGNADLRAEHSLQADLGMDVSGRIISLEAALFVNRIDNYIFADAVEAGSAATATAAATLPQAYRLFRYRQGDALLKGFEAGFDLHPIHQLHIGSTLSVVDARQLHQSAQSRYLPLTPPARLTAEAKWEFVHNGDHHSTAAHHARESEHHHRLDHVFDNAFVSVGVEHNFKQNHYYRVHDTETATPAYTLANITAGTDILLAGGRKLCEIYLIADNLFDVAYQSHLSRLKYAARNNVTGRQGIFNPGRNFTVKLIFPIKFTD